MLKPTRIDKNGFPVYDSADYAKPTNRRCLPNEHVYREDRTIHPRYVEVYIQSEDPYFDGQYEGLSPRYRQVCLKCGQSD